MKASLGCPIKEITNAGQCIFGEGGYAVDDALEADEDDGLVVQLIVGMVLASASVTSRDGVDGCSGIDFDGMEEC
jgi:hypothetical protein